METFKIITPEGEQIKVRRLTEEDFYKLEVGDVFYWVKGSLAELERRYWLATVVGRKASMMIEASYKGFEDSKATGEFYGSISQNLRDSTRWGLIVVDNNKLLNKILDDTFNNRD